MIKSPPIIIINVAIANHEDVSNKFMYIITEIVCIINNNPIDIGLFKNIVNDEIIIINLININFITANSLFKNLIFGSLRSILYTLLMF